MNDFYVYALFDADGIVRYIGKGHGPRMSAHLSENKKPFVADALAALGDVPRLKLRVGLSEHDAYSIEQALITAIGIEPDGPLVNKTAKGSGPNSRQVTKWWASKPKEERQAHMRAAIEAPRKPQTVDQRKQRIAAALATRTPEDHIAAAARMNATSSPEKRQAAAIKRVEGMTTEQRSEIGRRAIASQSKEQLSRIGRRRNEFITPEMRSEIGRKRSAHQTPEQIKPCLSG